MRGLIGVVVVALTLAVASPPTARAAVSVTASFEELVARADAVALVSPTDKSSVWEDGRIITYTRLRVERLIAGDLPSAVWVRTRGGGVGRVGQLVEGEASFVLGGVSLVFLQPYVDFATKSASGAFAVVEGGQGQFLVAGDARTGRLQIARGVGVLVQAKANVDGGAPSRGRDSALEALRDRPVDAAAREIAMAWARAHR